MSLRWVGAACAAALLSGCASFDGMPESVFRADDLATTVTNKYSIDTIYNYLDQHPNEQDRKVYRDRFVSAWLMAMDARYLVFRRDLSRNVKGGNVALDLVTLGLTGAGSVIASASQELSAAATAVGGARASFSRELYFQQTLPTLVSLMDAERLSVRADILKGLAQNESSYTVEQALADLLRYQSAGSLDVAIQHAAENAAQQSAAAKQHLDAAKAYCSVPPDLANARKALSNELTIATQPERDRLARAANLFSGKPFVSVTDPVSDADGIQAQQEVLANRLLAVCSQAELDDVRQKIESTRSAPAAEPAAPVPGAGNGGGGGT